MCSHQQPDLYTKIRFRSEEVFLQSEFAIAFWKVKQVILKPSLILWYAGMVIVLVCWLIDWLDLTSFLTQKCHIRQVLVCWSSWFSCTYNQNLWNISPEMNSLPPKLVRNCVFLMSIVHVVQKLYFQSRKWDHLGFKLNCPDIGKITT